MAEQTAKMNKRAGVLICGAYGMGNAGDEAILEAVVAEMRSIDAQMPITVLSRTPAETAKRLGVKSLHMFDLPGFLRVMGRSRLYINGGGSLIQDVTSSRSLWYYLFTLWAAKHRGCRVLMYGCGIGPVSRGRNRALAARIINHSVDEITLREENSLAELREYGVTKPRVEVTSDPALCLEKASETQTDEQMRAAGLEPEGKYVCFCLRNWPGYAQKAACFARAADYVRERYGCEPLFLAVNRKSDAAANAMASGQVQGTYVSVTESMSTALTIGILSRMQAIVSIRLHGLIFAASQAVPTVGVSYDPKVSAFLDYIGQTNYVQLEDVDAQGLKTMLDTALSADRKALGAAAQRVKDIEYRNVQAARRLMDEV